LVGGPLDGTVVEVTPMDCVKATRVRPSMLRVVPIDSTPDPDEVVYIPRAMSEAEIAAGLMRADFEPEIRS
jgi:hypothetical protein